MSGMKNQIALRGVRRLLMAQCSITLLAMLLAFVFCDTRAAMSALLGGFISILPNIFFAQKLFKFHGAQATKQIMRQFYKGEALKFGLSIVLFALVFSFINMNPLVFFAVYISVQLVIWFAPLMFV
jgi:ATP synthase protein I